MSAKRYIRLKELRPLSRGAHIPDSAYLALTDGSLKSGPFIWSTDEFGFLETGSSSTGGRQLFLMGDSFVESMFAQPTTRFAAVLESQVRARGHRVDVRNAGYSGATTLQTFNTMVNKIAPLTRPGDVILIFPSQSDAAAALDHGGYWGGSARYATLLPPRGTSQGSVADPRLETRKALRLIAAAARALELHVVVASTPFRQGNFAWDATLRNQYARNRSRYEKYLSFRLALIEDTAIIARETGLRHIAAADWLSGLPELFYDELHLNETGHEVLGKRLADEISLEFAVPTVL
ncbi:SGNH/GDSL hydrolase family protein [Microbacterium sp.]|uniref:SGNH/GDSL hydrolase family protein n=1 Tax=Microbacterium sp. TaxID=51671 RepID=UPI0028113377|nr:SGNH/GDSL hydrolase family protein [Microbacterium sp.]